MVAGYYTRSKDDGEAEGMRGNLVSQRLGDWESKLSYGEGTRTLSM